MSTEQEQYGIDAIKNLLDLGFKLHKGIASAMEDGKVTILDLTAFMPAAFAAPKALSNINLAWLQLSDLDDAEREEILAWAREQFDLSDDELELLIEDTLQAVLNDVRVAARWAKRAKK